ncbi:MAG: ribonuclease HII [Candidatus Marinimicrobia bacterium]|jgi:ribonuclease HII|nr:ribonuclease HII [Candidatus Neomarinimicrobiota bacterium]MDP6611081.1 ribonuclease HII [Candidatus Neomarinimicrobiota bacterium]|tara:strand:+ start:14733 stop:15659 length:927 start_codon:yes stop_codon:yes gene_type:complete
MEIIAGVDEAGRGPLAGPVVAAAVILPPNHQVEGLADSKKLSPKKREKVFDEIMAVAEVGIGRVSHQTIDQINILQATFKAMRKALGSLKQTPSKALIDGYKLPDQVIKNVGVIDGDNKVESISAASIVAKVTRDRIMLSVDPIFPEFGFARHKGYGTIQHVEALNKYKATPIHRKTYQPVKANLPGMRWLKISRRIGKLGEQLAALQYLKNGYQVIEMNRTCSHFGELDIIAEKNDEWVFIEVKTATKDQLGGPILKVDPAKLRKLESAIQYYLSEQDEEKDIRLDVVTVMLDKKPIIKTYKGIALD